MIQNAPSKNMKRIISLVLLAALSLCAARLAAAPVNSSQAANAVRGWLRTDAAPLGAKIGSQTGRVESFKDAKGTTLYHVVYLKPSGFVIVAADDGAEPIIAFVNEGRFDPSEKNPLGALVSRDLPQRIAHARKISGTQSAAKIQTKWKNLLDAWLKTQGGKSGGSVNPKALTTPQISDLRIGPLLASSWGQSTNLDGNDVYNFFTPPHAPGDTNNAVSGCVATMLAQEMYYFQYPNTGVGTNMFTFSYNNSPVLWDWPLRGGDDHGGPYDWASMTADPSHATLNQCTAIGRLTYDAGIAVHMQYTPTLSGAYMSDAKTALVTTFKFANAVITESNSINVGYDLGNMIDANLDARLPVLFGIVNSVGGHAVVCDGYGYDAYNTQFHHLNMGWDGLDNAWYHLPLIDLTNTAPFSTFTACIYNIFTNATGEIISGRVLDNNGVPLAGANVTATTLSGGIYSATADSRGIYALVGLPANTTFTLTAAANGYFPASRPCTTGHSVDESPLCGNVWGANFGLLLAQGPPVFVAQPGNLNLVVGSSASFNVIVTGQLPLSYQWQYLPNGGFVWNNFSDGGGVSGSQTAGLVINPVALGMTGESIRCVVSNPLGTTNSTAATLTVVGIAPSFSLQPSSQSVVAGSNATFTAFATGTSPIVYQWQFQPSGSLTWSNLLNATNTTLLFSPADLTQNGMPLECVAANAWGSATSTPAYLFVTPNNSTPISIYTLAGKPLTAGATDGVGTNALFYDPLGIAVDANTNIFVADMKNHVIRMISPSGLGWSSATIAGLAGNSGTADGTGSAARFNGPYGIAVDASGNVYVADTSNHTIRELVQSGTYWNVTTILGSAGSSGTNNGIGGAARLRYPMGVATDNSGNLFVADEGNQTIRKAVFSAGNWNVSTIAGFASHSGTNDGTNYLAKFNGPYSVAADNSGRVFVADYYNNCIRQITPNGSNWVVTTIGVSSANGGSTDGAANVARFKYPTSIVAAPDGNLYVADSGNNTIRRIAPTGLGWTVFTVAGLAGNSGSVDGTGSTARLNTPFGIAVDASTNLYISDASNDTIRGPAPVLTPVPSVVNLFKLVAARTLTITWNAVAGHTYQVQYKTNLSQSVWNVYTNITAGNWTGSVSLNVAADPQRFYRVIPAP
jgi:Peptidase C10 family/Spi protease inhibitor/Carboxypeptidase regulatory-like domain/NHL repeat